MLNALTLPALAVLFAFPGFGFKKPVATAPVDTLPPRWKTASRLALESSFVTSRLRPLGPPGPGALRLTYDPRKFQVSFDPDSGEVELLTEFGEVPLGESVRIPVHDYARDLNRRTFEDAWRLKSRNSINLMSGQTSQARTGGFSFALPSPLPKRVQSWLGPGGPAINVSGSENISLSGTSNWTNQQVGLVGTKRSLFPSLDMQQNLDIRLEGQLSDRIKVNLLQNSANQIPLANRIAINYHGEEDDVVQEFDLGNTSLSLPGTQYVSYSGKNEGLFGAKLATRLGPLDFTVLASKQEGRSERASYGGGASRQQQTLLDADWIRDAYFFFYDPNVEALDIDLTSLRVYYDDNNAYNKIAATVKGRAYVDPRFRGGATFQNDTAYVSGTFVLKDPSEYDIMPVYGPYFRVLHMHQPLVYEQRLAVSYNARPAGSTGSYDIHVGGTVDADTNLVLKMIRAPQSMYTPDSTGFYFDSNNRFEGVRDLMLKNFYQLPGQRIDAKTFQLSVHRDVTVPYVTTVQRGGASIPYIELLGLDNLDETKGSPTRGHDGTVDGTALRDQANGSQYVGFVDYDNGVLFFPDPRPFAPRLAGTDARSFDSRVSNTLFRRDSLTAVRDSSDGANRQVYDRYTPRRNEDALYYIDVDFTAGRASGEIQLGRGNIMEGSDVVTVNGQPLVRDRDYTIDYDLGRVNLKRQLGATDNLNIDYSYAPLFQQAGRTLLGSAFRLEGRERSLGGAFLYESRGAQDLRPRLGEEPSRSLIGDLNTEWTFHPSFLTRAVDRLPGVRTTTPSDFHVQAEGGMSFPNPNTRNEVFIDDMEGVRDAVSLAMDPLHWRYGSVPSRMTDRAHSLSTSFLDLSRQHNAEVHWFLPPTGIKEKDLKPNLTDAQGAKNNRQALAISVPRRPLTSTPEDSLWVSLTYPLDAAGLDLTRSQFIEIWVNDFNDQHDGTHVDRIRGHHVKLHLDLGKVSEDQMRAPDEPPNFQLDTEDRNRDGQLSATDADNEDTGYDGKLSPKRVKGSKDVAESGAIRDLTTAWAEDPEGDDYGGADSNYPNDIDTRKFRYTNGTENNRQLNPTPDTEDLNGDGALGTTEGYYEYTIDLGDDSSAYLATDVQRDFPGYGVVSDNGWRRYRIPIADTARVQFGSANLALAQHLRLWVEGLITVDPKDDGSEPIWSPDGGKTHAIRPLLVLGGLDIVGSRWVGTPLTDAQNANGTTLTINSVNTQDNADEYVAPFNPGETVSNSQTLQRREQSLALEFTQMNPGDTLETYKTFSIDEDYSRYGKLDWYVTGFDIPGYDPASDTLWYFVRFASDENGRNYYEYRSRVPFGSRRGDVRWTEVKLALTDLSNLKLRRDFPKVDPIFYVDSSGAATYVIKGRPSFTRLRRISVGLINGAGVTAKHWTQGRLWVDEFRATDVAKDVGHAGRVAVNGNLANLLAYTGSVNMRDANFLSVGETRGSGSSQNQVNFGGTFQAQRFFEGTGISLPLSYNYGRTSSKPRFTPGDDVVRTGALADASESYTRTQNFTASYSRSWSERSNPLLRFTVGGITAGFSKAWSDGHNPSSVSKHDGYSENVNWDIAPRNAWTLGVPHTKLRFYPLPERLYWHYSMQSSRDTTWDRLQDSTASLLLRSAQVSRTAMVTFGGDSRPFDLVHHHFEGVRNLSLDPSLLKQGGMLGRINFGRVTQWSQSMDGGYTFQRGTPWLRPRLSWNSSYSQNNGPELSSDLSVRSIVNGQGAHLTWDLPFDKLARPVVAMPAKRDSGAAPPPRPPFRVGDLVGRLGQVSFDASVQKSSSYSRLSGTPSLAYLFGLASDPGFGAGRVLPELGNVVGKSLTRDVQMRQRIDVGFGAAISSRGEVSDRQTESNSVVSSSTALRFPDIEVEYGHIPSVIHLDRVLNNARLRTALNRSQSWDRLGGDMTGTADGWLMQPLFAINGDLHNGTRAELKIDKRSTMRKNFQLGETRTSEDGTTVNLTLNRTYSQGQKVNVLGRETTVRTNISLGLTGSYETKTGQTVRVVDGIEGPAQFPKDESDISLRGTGSYGFSSNVTGNAALGFLQTHNVQQDIMRRSITVELRAQFTF